MPVRVRRLLSLALLLSLLAASLPAPAAAAVSSPEAGLDPAAYLRPDGTLDVPAGFSGGFDLNGWDVSLHPSRGVVLRPQAAVVGQWTSLGGAGTGLNPTVYTIVFNGGVLYAGGDFTDAGGDPDADNIAKFSGGVWSSLGGVGTGLNSAVVAITFNGGVLYAGGNFTDAGGDTNADYIAQFSSGAWFSLGGAGTGVNGIVRAIKFDGGVLYAGGSFTDAGGDSDADGIAQFSGGAWSSLGGVGTGLNDSVFVIAFNGGVLYAGGNFTDAGGDSDADRIAQFSSGVWSSLGGVGTGLGSIVRAIEFDGGVLYAGGDFTDAGGDSDADYIAQFSSGAWSSLGGASTGLNGNVIAIEFNGGVLYAGGNFADAGGDSDADRIAKFSGGSWSSLGGAGTGLNSLVYAIEFNGGVLYAAGGFANAGGDPDADRVAQFGLPTGSGGGSSGGGSSSASASKAIASSGVTTLELGRIIVSIPATAIPPGQTNCVLAIQQSSDSSAVFGFALDDTVWDVKIRCNNNEINLFFDALTACIRPVDGVLANKNVYHRHGANSFEPLSGGQLAGYVCGQTRQLSLFTLGQLALPATGFAPGRVSALAEQPAEAAYTTTDLSLSIPKLGVELDILGVPQGVNGWDVSWLQADQAGYLYGTSFPTWEGNSVLTAHVWNADNTPGPFHQLSTLRYGDRFTVIAYGHTYTYEVRSNQLMQPQSMNPLRDSEYSLITLVTCERYDPITGDYLYRRAVQAVLVDVQ